MFNRISQTGTICFKDMVYRLYSKLRHAFLKYNFSHFALLMLSFVFFSVVFAYWRYDERAERFEGCKQGTPGPTQGCKSHFL